jgi:hypothetical protein
MILLWNGATTYHAYSAYQVLMWPDAPRLSYIPGIGVSLPRFPGQADDVDYRESAVPSDKS